jgi:hypothetical protein
MKCNGDSIAVKISIDNLDHRYALASTCACGVPTDFTVALDEPHRALHSRSSGARG